MGRCAACHSISRCTNCRIARVQHWYVAQSTSQSVAIGNAVLFYHSWSDYQHGIACLRSRLGSCCQSGLLSEFVGIGRTWFCRQPFSNLLSNDDGPRNSSVCLSKWSDGPRTVSKIDSRKVCGLWDHCKCSTKHQYARSSRCRVWRILFLVFVHFAILDESRQSVQFDQTGSTSGAQRHLEKYVEFLGHVSKSVHIILFQWCKTGDGSSVINKMHRRR